uniref:SWI/SNF nucleosome remodeling complex component n=1 Tax=Cacopsylla melanoneura TaxID=428564 RepID=A0A8D8WGN7_9HEMI
MHTYFYTRRRARNIPSSSSSSSPSTTSNTDPASPSQPCPPLAPLSQSNKPPTNNSTSSSSSSIQSSSSSGGTNQASSPGDSVQSASSASLVDGTSVVVNGGISNSINMSSAGDTSDQTYKENIAKQSLMLVDLLEKSISDRDPPTINGAISRIGEKGLDLFTSIDSKTRLSQQQQAQSNTSPAANVNSTSGMISNVNNTPNVNNIITSVNNSSGVIRRVSTELEARSNMNNAGKANGTTTTTTNLPPVKQNGADQQVVGLKRPRPHDGGDANEQPVVKKVYVNGDINLPPVEEQDENNVKASSTAANLYAALAADVLEDEDIVEVTPAGLQQTIPPAQQPSQPQPGQNIIMTTGGGGPASGPGGGGRQQILVTGGTGGLPQRLQMMGQHYVVTQQPQLVQGHSGQTVLVAQTGGQQGGPGAKTIIILQPSSSASPSPNTLSSNKTSIPPSTTITTNTNQKVIVSVPPLGANAPGTPSNPAGHTSVVHRTPIRPQPGVMSSNSPATTVIKQVPDTRPPRPPSGFQQQFLQSQKLLQQQPSQPSPQQQQQPLPGQFICEWRGCMRNFKSANEVYMHACECHCPVTPSQEIQCLWERCDAMRRKRFSHMTHLYDRHCNPDVLKMMAVRRKQLSLSGKTEIPPPTAPAPHPGYAPNAAFNAIKRHALEFVNPKELQDENEGPVTKSIRLTSSLILRNLVIYSNTCRRHLISYEPHLASVALSNVESSKTIAQVLFDMNDTQNR